jgi:hypothetical protein
MMPGPSARRVGIHARSYFRRRLRSWLSIQPKTRSFAGLKADASNLRQSHGRPLEFESPRESH